jgi:hypothetical protein
MQWDVNGHDGGWTELNNAKQGSYSTADRHPIVAVLDIVDSPRGWIVNC